MGEEAAAAPKKELKVYSAEEIAKHNTEKDCWVSMHGLVVEIRQDLQNEHPGGPEVILALAGKDVTADFEDIGHSDTAREWTDKYIIGYTEDCPEEKKTGRCPRNKDLAGEGGAPSIGVLPLIVAVALVIAAYIFFNQ